MKKILSLILALTISMGIFASCEKNSSDSLVGTSWENTFIDGVTVVVTTLTFAEDTFQSTVTFDNPNDFEDRVERNEGTYTFDGTTIRCTLNRTDSDGNPDVLIFSGTINGDEMTVVYDEYPDYHEIFTKK